ncbi:MAG: hypothetical protein L6Q76_26535 [Polyangiaceae bacterium]|nr:hypothetical protein [Polyangiaceae bacterium]
MPEPRFDPSKAVTFDLGNGLVHVEGAPSLLLVPGEALAELCAAAGPEAVAAFGRSIGEPMGQRLASRFAAAGVEGAVGGASLDAVVDHLGGEIAVAGLGSLELERWGHALVLVIDHSPLGAGGDALIEALLAAAIETATGKRVRTLALAREATRARFLVAGNAAVEKARAWLAGGMSWGEALAKLHSKSPAARGDA